MQNNPQSIPVTKSERFLCLPITMIFVEGLLCVFSWAWGNVLNPEGARNLLGILGCSMSEEANVLYVQRSALFGVIVFGMLLIAMRILCHRKRMKEQKETYASRQLLRQLKEVSERYQLLSGNVGMIVKWQLQELARQLKFETHDRISLYIPRGGVFVRVARYSINKNYNIEGRSRYPLKEGVIGKAWTEGSPVMHSSLPDYSTKPDAYIRKSREMYVIDSDTIRNLTMHPRTIVSFRISDEKGDASNGVLVIESMKNARWRQKDVLTRARACIPGLHKLISAFYDTIPTLLEAQKEGL